MEFNDKPMTPRELVKVKELEWVQLFDGAWKATAPLTLYEYYVSESSSPRFYYPGQRLFDKPTPVPNDACNIDGYKAACQAHHDNAVYELLEIL